MRRLLWPLALFAIGAFPAAAERTTEALFDVKIFGIKLGEFQIGGTNSVDRYSATARFRTTGIVDLVGRVHFDLSSGGARQDGQFTPVFYAEELDTGRRQSSARLDYTAGVPRLTGGSLGDEEREVLDPQKQGGTVDPLTAMFMAARDQNTLELCNIDRIVFDGARRTRLMMKDRRKEDDQVICSGKFVRLGGYSERQLNDGREFTFEVTYAPVQDAMRMDRAVVRSSRGTVTLVRR
ncbi:DUF3108 domain-containing protein [Primorskyibacter sp. S87]|uniref:DUF3108 domain-containing protein n=1 Tax=Primorskyibacter sp. S87 TaxID=3415126 RepID=UPI003C7CB00D